MALTFAIGDYVRAKYKSGEYIGEVVSLHDAKAKVRVLAVIKHPAQGSLHRPMDPDVRLFHQRKALAFREICLVLLDEMQIFDGEIPDYEQSLQLSLEAEIEILEDIVKYEGSDDVDSKMALWAKASLESLYDLKQDYRL